MPLPSRHDHVTTYSVVAYTENMSFIFNDNSTTPGAGTTAYTQVANGQDVLAETDGDGNIYTVFIPYDSVRLMEYVKTVSIASKPSDANCS